MRLVIVGPPGAGKGTQAKLICERYNIPHISTGDMFRKNISEGNEVGKAAQKYINQGILVPDDIVNRMVKERISQPDAKNGFLFDGYPRTVDQAEIFKALLSDQGFNLDAVFNLGISREKLIDRLTGRRICEKCGASFNVITNPSKVDGICDYCGGNLTQRPDDNVEVTTKRVDVYMNETMPLIDYYRSAHILYEINADGPIDRVFEDICKVLEREVK
jgi:adenylate kinase